MAAPPVASPASRPKGKFSVTNPGLKEYAIVFLGVLIVAGGVFWYERRKANAAAASSQDSSGSGSGTVYYPSPTGLSAAQLLAWISDHQASPAPAPAQPTAPAPTPAPAGKAKTVTVPKVTGERANFAIGELESSGLKWNSATGPRNAKDTYVVSKQNPAAGSSVPAGTSVGLSFKKVA